MPESKFNIVKVFGKIFLLNTFIFLSFSVFGQFVSFSNEFLKIGATAQGISTGNSIAAQVKGSSALYYNPANITKLANSLDFTITHSEYFSGIANYDFASVAYKYKSNISLAAGFIRLGVDNIPNTLSIYSNGSFDLDRITYFSVEDYAFFLAIAKQHENLSYALRSKIIYRHLGQFVNGYGFGVDAAITYHRGKNIFAANFNDILGTFTAWFYNLDSTVINVFDSTGNAIPQNGMEFTIPSTIMAWGRTFQIAPKWTLAAETDIYIELAQKNNMLLSTRIFSLSPHLGAELQFKDVLFIRAGMSNFQKVTYFTGKDSVNTSRRINFFPQMGIGFRYHSIFIDYAFQNFLNSAVALRSHFITIRFSLGKKPEKSIP